VRYHQDKNIQARKFGPKPPSHLNAPAELKVIATIGSTK